MPAARHDAGLQALVDSLHGRGDLPALAVCVLDAKEDVCAWAGAGDAPGLGGATSRFRVASVTKTAMALTAHRLAPAVPLDAALLSHTAGLPMELPGVDWLGAPPADADALGVLLDALPPPADGAPFRYSNTGFWLLARRLRAATGQTVETLVAETLTAVGGGAQLDFGAADLTGHLVTARGRIVPSVASFAPARRPSGGLAADLPSVAWLGRALLRALAVTPALADERASIAEGWGWTAGLERWTTAGRPLYGHHGSWGGTRTQLVLDPADGRVAAAAVTTEAGAPALRALLTAIGLPPPSPVASAASSAGLPLGAFGDAVVGATLAADPTDPDGLVLRYPVDGPPRRAHRLDAGLARILDGPAAGEALTTTSGGDVLRIGVRSLDRA